MKAEPPELNSLHSVLFTTPIRQWVRTDAGIGVPADPLIQLIEDPPRPLVTPGEDEWVHVTLAPPNRVAR